MKRVSIVVLLLCLMAWGDAGVLIPSNLKQPDPSVLSLAEMAIDIWIDNSDARVLVRQVYASHHPAVLEGNYVFALSGRATVSDFAVWDGVTRIPGVILERKRAAEIYRNLRWQALDPGLLQAGERGEDEARRGAVFTARVAPIPTYGTKRVEIEYHESIPVENLASFLAIPLRPDAYQALTAGHLWITLELRSAHAVTDFQAVSKLYPLQITERTPNLIRARYEATNVNLAEDFAVRYTLDGSKGGALAVLTHRDPGPESEPGFFQASALLASGPAAPADAPKTVIALFDNSLSMQFEKLERSFQALETLLRALRPQDRFNLLLFNSNVEPFRPAPVAAAPVAIDQALTFIRAARLRGGTDLEKALAAGLAQVPAASAGESYVVLLSDGGATQGTVQSGRLVAWYERQAQARHPRTFVWAVGDDANTPLLRMMARNNGLIEWVRSTEPVDFKLSAFLGKIGRRPVENLRVAAEPAGNFDLVYPLEDSWFPGSVASWVGQYKKPATSATFTAGALRATAALPAENLEHPQLPREWAAARVKALVEKIEREGEDRASIDEIVRLARKYKFVTPYTSFLAAPRALLRPRLIRPGDPVLRVKTDDSIASVTALFPFGLVKPLRHLKDEDIWQTRFLAPVDLADGTYQVRLILRDKTGQVFREQKSFVIASKPPVVRVKLDKNRFRRGETIRLRVSASETTRTVVARLSGSAAVYLRWNPQAGTNTGELVIPGDLPAGPYTLTITAEDMAHNIGSQEVRVDVAP